MSDSQVSQVVKDYVLEEFLQGEDPDALETSTPLITGGILDSIATIKLVTFLEERYSIEFDAHEMGKDHLDTLDSIANIVSEKLNKS